MAKALFDPIAEMKTNFDTLSQYEKEIEKAPAGKRYQECYDLRTVNPLDDYVRLYDDAKEEVTKMGIPFE